MRLNAANGGYGGFEQRFDFRERSKWMSVILAVASEILVSRGVRDEIDQEATETRSRSLAFTTSSTARKSSYTAL